MKIKLKFNEVFFLPGPPAQLQQLANNDLSSIDPSFVNSAFISSNRSSPPVAVANTPSIPFSPTGTNRQVRLIFFG